MTYIEKAPGLPGAFSFFSITAILAAQGKLIGNGDVLLIVQVRQGLGLTRPV
jgi:hypothetical protein